jgi:hypothetical protein
MHTSDMHTHTHTDPETDLLNLIETVENLYIHITDIYKDVRECKQLSLSRSDLEAMCTGQIFEDGLEKLREIYPSVMRRILTYTRSFEALLRPPKPDSDSGTPQKDCSASEARHVAREIMVFLDEKNRGILPKFESFVRTMGVEQTRILAKEAKRRVSSGEIKKQPGGEFMRLCNAQSDPIDKENFSRLQRALQQGYESWKPHKYQSELANMAAQGSSVIVLPTGSGKTKIAALILDHLWRQNPGAKCVVVAQEVSLVLQQIEVLLRSCKPFKTDENGGKKGPSGGAFGSFNPVPNMTWPDLLKKYDIMVYTPQTLINLLDAKEMHGRQVLMCLDR